MTKKIRLVLIFTIIFIAIIAIISYLKISGKQPGRLDSFAQCLTSQGALFYGAFWCSHCQDQKKLFGSSEKYLPYVECSSLDGQSQMPLCAQNGISSYPTWTFSDGSRLMGSLALNELSTKTACALP